MNEINKRIAELSPAKRALLEQRLKEKAVNTNHQQTISRRANQEEAPLSFAQTRMWFLDQLEPGNPVYNRPTNIRLIGRLNVAVLELCLNEIVRRHEVLRTSFPAVDGKPVQVIAPSLTLSLPLVDISNVPSQDKQAKLQQLATEEAQRALNLSLGSLVRATLVRLGESEHILLLTLHHIIFDGWSVGVLLKELAFLHKAFGAGKPSTLSELPIQYADFAHWQQQHLHREVLESQLGYWKTQLGGNLPVLELPTDRARSPVQTFRGARQHLLLPKSLTQSLKALSQREGVTLFMTLLAAFKILLYRYTNSDDIVVGSPIAGRNRTETEKLIGVFINTLVLRTYVDGKLSFLQLLAVVRKVAIDAYAHQDIPFEKLVEELQPNRDLSHTPLFQVLFQLRNLPNVTVEVQGLRFEDFQFDRGIAAFDLTLDIVDTPDGLACRFEYNTDLFYPETIVRMAGHFQTLLEGIVANLEQPIAQLPILTAAEQHKLLVEWNDTHTDYPKDKCIHQLFEEQVERTPDAVAVVLEDELLTYRQLNRRANQLAHYLQSLGVGADVLVGICVERSLNMVVGLLGILKAGGAYVPLDLEYPTERLSFMLEDAAVSVLLTQNSLVERLPQHKAQLVCLDSDWESIKQQSQENINTSVTTDNLAYVIYTSGSTGQPKGVLVAHTGLLNLVFWHQRAFEITPLDKATQLAGTAFDAAVWELWPYLMVGASIYLVKSELLGSPRELRDWLILQKVTISFLPTPLAQELLSLEWTQSVAMRCILTGGDKLHHYPSDLVPFQVVNNYGPTENTVVTTSGLVVANERSHISPPIGRPIANTQIYILDSHLQPVPIGVPGELHVSGAGLARGYLNRPQLTQEKFIPNPFDESKLYKTGDLARYLPDGNIEYLGRIDNQVKIRGFRIELGEIETVLSQHPQIHSVVVIARQDTPGVQRLVAYIVAQHDTAPTISELRQFLKTNLPEYMVPSAFIMLESLPLTPNGKVDRRALPTPDMARPELSQTFVAPRNPIEEMLASQWADVLRVEQVGIYDNFFELGGHSLLATSVISHIREAFAIEFPLRSLFEAPTIASLSKAIETARQVEVQEQSEIGMKLDTLPPLVPGARDTYIPLSFAQKYIWDAQQLAPDSCSYNSSFALRFTGSLSSSVLESSINEIIRRHEILRTTFPVLEGQPVQDIAPSLTLPLKIVDLQNLPKQEREVEAKRLAAQKAQHHFDLASSPPIETTLLRLATEEHWLLITMHHIVTDGGSVGVFLEELGTLYNAFSNGLLSSKGAAALTPLPELPFQYADFTLWQRKHFNEKVLEKQLSYRLQKLVDISLPFDVVPIDRSRHGTNSRRASFYSVVLPESLVASIEDLSRSQGVTIFVIILTALTIVLFKWSGKPEILVLATIGNRSTPEIERMLGCFINDVILRSQLSAEQTGLTLLKQVKETVIEAIDNKDVSLEKVIEAIKSQRELTLSASITMKPPLNWHNRIVEGEFVSFSRHRKLWNEEIPLELYVSSPSEDSQPIEIEVYYSTELFTNETIAHLFSYYQEILHKFVGHPETKLSEFE